MIRLTLISMVLFSVGCVHYPRCLLRSNPDRLICQRNEDSSAEVARKPEPPPPPASHDPAAAVVHAKAMHAYVLLNEYWINANQAAASGQHLPEPPDLTVGWPSSKAIAEAQLRFHSAENERRLASLQRQDASSTKRDAFALAQKAVGQHPVIIAKGGEGASAAAASAGSGFAHPGGRREELRSASTTAELKTQRVSDMNTGSTSTTIVPPQPVCPLFEPGRDSCAACKTVLTWMHDLAAKVGVVL